MIPLQTTMRYWNKFMAESIQAERRFQTTYEELKHDKAKWLKNMKFASRLLWELNFRWDDLTRWSGFRLPWGIETIVCDDSCGKDTASWLLWGNVNPRRVLYSLERFPPRFQTTMRNWNTGSILAFHTRPASDYYEDWNFSTLADHRTFASRHYEELKHDIEVSRRSVCGFETTYEELKLGDDWLCPEKLASDFLWGIET
jgi:hypothetical protein